LELGLTINEVAGRAGLSMQYVANLELGRGNPTLSALSKIAEALDTSAGRLLVESDASAEAGETALLEAMPKSLVAFSRSDRFKAKVWRIAQVAGVPVDEMRHQVLLGMTTAPRRRRGEPGSEDWGRLLDAYDLIIRG
jgi:transcriptional regulator with XRE-family HTH domain